MHPIMQPLASRLTKTSLRPALSLRRLAALAALALTAFSYAPAHASFGVMPRELGLQNAKPGGRVSDEVEVYNGSEETLFISASAIDWTSNENGDVQFAEAGTTPRSCAKWVQFSPLQFTLEPKKSVRVRINATIPAEFTQEHWAMIFFESKPMPVKGENFQLNISMRVGCKLFITPEGATGPTGRIADMNLLTKNGPQVQVLFENTSLRQLRVAGNVEMRAEDGTVVAKGVLQPGKAQILSKTKRQVIANLDQPLQPGVYRVKAILDYGAKALTAGEMKVKVANPVALVAPPAAEAKPAAVAAAPAEAKPAAPAAPATN